MKYSKCKHAWRDQFHIQTLAAILIFFKSWSPTDQMEIATDLLAQDTKRMGKDHLWIPSGQSLTDNQERQGTVWQVPGVTKWPRRTMWNENTVEVSSQVTELYMLQFSHTFTTSYKLVKKKINLQESRFIHSLDVVVCCVWTNSIHCAKYEKKSPAQKIQTIPLDSWTTYEQNASQNVYVSPTILASNDFVYEVNWSFRLNYTETLQSLDKSTHLLSTVRCYAVSG